MKSPWNPWNPHWIPMESPVLPFVFFFVLQSLGWLPDHTAGFGASESLVPWSQTQSSMTPWLQFPRESQPVSIARGNKLNEQLNQLTNKNCWLLPGKALDLKVKLIVQCDFHASVTNGSPRMRQPSKPLPFFMEEFLAHSSTASGGPKLQELQRRALKSRSWDICHSEYRLSNAEKFGFVGSDEFHGYITACVPWGFASELHGIIRAHLCLES